MNRKHLILFSLLFGGAQLASALPLHHYTITKVTDGGSADDLRVTRGKVYQFTIRGVDEFGAVPTQQAQANVRIIFDGSASAVIVAPTANAGVYSPDTQGELNILVRFNLPTSENGSINIRAEHSSDINKNGTMSNLLVEDFPASFNIATPANVTAGQPFTMIITALDGGGDPVTSFKDNVTVSDEFIGDILTIFGPEFDDGIEDHQVTLRAGDAVTHLNRIHVNNTITYVGQATQASGTSNPVFVAPAAYDRVVLLFPGETLTPGIPPGKSTATINSQISNVPVSPVTLYATDEFYNPLTVGFPGSVNVSFQSTEPGDTVPVPQALNGHLILNGQFVFPSPLGERTVRAIPSDNTGNNSQSVFDVKPGAVSKYEFITQPPAGSILTADVPFTVVIRALDQGGNTKTDFTGTITGAMYMRQLPSLELKSAYVDTNSQTEQNDNSIFFQNGIATLTNRMLITAPSNESQLVFYDGVVDVATTTTHVVQVGSAKKILMTILPDQDHTPGIFPGNSGIPPLTDAGSSRIVEVRITDGRWNVVDGNDVNNTFVTIFGQNSTPAKYIDVRVNGVDTPTVDMPGSGEAIGSLAPVVTFRTSGTQFLRAQRASGPLNLVGNHNSQNITVTPGAYARMMLVGPGEVPNPGIQPSLSVDALDGKLGAVTPQSVGSTFTVRAIAADEYWNPINVPTYPLINFNFQDPARTLSPSAPMQMGASQEVFNVTLQSLSLPQIEVFDTLAGGDPKKRQTISVNAAPGNLHHFAIDPISSPKLAGAPFNVLIRAEDQFGNIIPQSRVVNLVSNTGNGTISPTSITLAADGTFNGAITMTASTATAVITMSSPNAAELPATRNSNSFVINPNPSPMGMNRLVMLLPGEVLTQGIAPGKSGTASPTQAGFGTNITVFICDPWYNPILQDGSFVLSSDRHVTFPAVQTFGTENGISVYSRTAQFRSAGLHTVTVRDLNNDHLVARSTSTINVTPAAFSKIQLVAPGETPDPGSTNPTGKLNAPIAQKAGVPFNVTIRAVDEFWNLINLNGRDIALEATTPAVLYNPPNNEATPGTGTPRPFVNGLQTREIILGQEGLFELTAFDRVNINLRQTVEIDTDAGPVYTFELTTTAVAGVIFPKVTITLQENGVILTNYTGTIVLNANLASGGTASGNFTPQGPASYLMTNGVAEITDLTYAYVERIRIRVSDNFNRVGFSPDIEVEPSGLKYDITVPNEAIAGPPLTFNVTVRLLERNTGTLVKNHDHQVLVDVIGSGTNDGEFSVTSANLSQGVATFQQSYTKAETVAIEIRETTTPSSADPRFDPPTNLSNPINVKADGYKKLLLLGPGETHMPGIPSVTGKTGTLSTRQLGVAFLVQMKGVDQYWNVAKEFNGGQIHLDTTNEENPSLGNNNPVNQNAPLVNGESAASIALFNGGAIDVIVSDLSNNSIGVNTARFSVQGNKYVVDVAPGSKITGPPTTFTMTITLVDSLNGNTVTNANHTIDLSVVPSAGGVAQGILGITQANIVAGVANIPDQSYTIAEDIIIKVVERTNSPIKNLGQSGTINMIPRLVRYTFEIPSDATVNVPFNITVRTIDQDTGTPVKNFSRTNALEAFSSQSGIAVSGTFVPSGPNAVNIVDGVAQISATYNRTESIFFKMTDNTGSGATSAPVQAEFLSQGSVVVHPGKLSEVIDLVTGQSIADLTMQSNERRVLRLQARDAFQNPISDQTLVFTMSSNNQPNQIILNGQPDNLTQKTNGQGEIQLTIEPTDIANGAYTMHITDGDEENGLTLARNLQILGFPVGPSRAFGPGEDRQSVNTPVFLDIVLPNLPDGVTVRTYYRVNESDWYTYNNETGILPVEAGRPERFFHEPGKWDVEWYSEICYDVACANPIDERDVKGAANFRAIPFTAVSNYLAAYPSPFNPKNGGFVTFQYGLEHQSSVEVDIYDLFGQKVWHKDISAGDEGGQAKADNQVLWYGANDSGTTVANGGYIVTIKVGSSGQLMRRKFLVVK